MSRKRPGWRAAERTYRSLSRALARRAAESVRQEREAGAATVCPDGDGCQDAGCVAARAAFQGRARLARGGRGDADCDVRSCGMNGF